jgi:hypothetical protein
MSPTTATPEGVGQCLPSMAGRDCPTKPLPCLVNRGSSPRWRRRSCTRQQDRFSLGVTRSEVAAVQGVPSGYYPTYWRYGLATVDFDGDRVKSWTNSGNTLRVNN